MPLTAIDGIVEKKTHKKIIIMTKDMRLLKFIFREAKTSSKFFKIIQNYTDVKPIDSTKFAICFAKEVNKMFHSLPLIDENKTLMEEYERFGISFGVLSLSPWRISSENNSFQLCESYPPHVCVPTVISDNNLYDVVKFRAQRRFPVLTWKHSSSDSAIVRCGQPLIGPSASRNSADESLLLEISRTNKKNSTLYVIDCRAKAVSIANMATGGGYEFESYYSNTKVEFMGIENIHSIRESFRNLFRLINSDDTGNWLSKLESTSWLKHISTILYATRRVVDLISKEKATVVVHCSDGWDRTSQVCALSQLCLDPYYRTIDGFLVLLQKDWIMFGHKFHTRSFDTNERSPIFLQFIDCVYQLIDQFPTEFEFNGSLLLDLVDALHDCRFGTFLFDSHKERMENNLLKTTISFWQYVNEFKSSYINIYYQHKIDILEPIYYERRMKFFDNFFWRYDQRMKPQIPVTPEEVYEEKIKTIEKGLESLRNEEFVSNEYLLDQFVSLIQNLKPLSEPKLKEPISNRQNDSLAEIKKEDEINSRYRSHKTIHDFYDLSILKSERPRWIPDGKYTDCRHCSQKLFKGNRHHCRCCGHLFCSECSSSRLRVPNLGYFSPVRVCPPCCKIVLESSFNQKKNTLSKNVQ